MGLYASQRTKVITALLSKKSSLSCSFQIYEDGKSTNWERERETWEVGQILEVIEVTGLHCFQCNLLPVKA